MAAESKLSSRPSRFCPSRCTCSTGGIPSNRKGEVEPASLSFLKPVALPKDSADLDRRKALAEWIVDPENPLTARVVVNRIWQWHFGTGLVATANDFGNLGVEPSHPELLDWLAANVHCSRAGQSKICIGGLCSPRRTDRGTPFMPPVLRKRRGLPFALAVSRAAD